MEIDTTVSASYDQTLIILDWDDTLLASSWLAINDLRLDCPKMLDTTHRRELEALEQRVVTLITRILSLGRVILVTNAETGWVELSAERFLPKVCDLFPQLKIISARSQFEAAFPNQPSQWKIQAFHQEIGMHVRGTTRDQRANVISIGDSQHEREALHVVTATLVEDMWVKSIKFVERPGMDVLRRQIELIHGCIDYIAQHAGDLDLMLSHKLLFDFDGGESKEPEPISAKTKVPAQQTGKIACGDERPGAVVLPDNVGVVAAGGGNGGVSSEWDDFEAMTTATS